MRLPSLLLIGAALLMGCATPSQTPIAKGYVIDPCGKPGEARRATRAEARRARKERRRSGMSVHCAPSGPTHILVEDMIPMI